MSADPQQYDLCLLRGGGYVVVIQHDLFANLRSRVVVPLVGPDAAGRPVRWLNPVLTVGDMSLQILPEFISAIPVSEIDTVIANIAFARDQITRAVDMLLSGV